MVSRAKTPRRQAAKALTACRPATRHTRAKPVQLRAEPGPDARKLLSIVTAINDAWVSAPDERTDRTLYREHVQRHHQMITEGERVARRIANRLVRSVADVVDKAVAWAWLQASRDRSDTEDNIACRMLAIGGLKWADIDETRWEATSA